MAELPCWRVRVDDADEEIIEAPSPELAAMLALGDDDRPVTPLRLEDFSPIGDATLVADVDGRRVSVRRSALRPSK